MARRKPKYQREAEERNAPPPPHPPNRVAADISQQAPHTSFGGVPLYYEDQTIRCIACGKEEVWTAERQKWWYETAKGHIFSNAVRCRACRRKLRAEHGGTPRRPHRERTTGVSETPSLPVNESAPLGMAVPPASQ